MYKIIIFDLDGTLANTLEDLADAVNYGLKKEGLPVHSVEKYKIMVGNGADMLIKRAIAPVDDESVFERVKGNFNIYYNKHSIDKTVAYDGISRMLSVLKEKNIVTAVLSNKPDQFVSNILNKIYPQHKFEYEWGKKPEYKVKPNPEALIAILDKAGFSREECLYVGDSNVDCYTAKNAGVKCCGVSWGFRGREELVACGADFIIDNPMELIDFV